LCIEVTEFNTFLISELRKRVSYDPSDGQFTWLSHRCSNFIGSPAGWWGKNGYRIIQIGELKLLAHRVAWTMQTGAWPKIQIDHIDGDPKNNRFINLRPATQAQNLRNKCIQSNCKSGVQGVVWREEREKWMAYINVNGRFRHLGYFDDLGEATEARRNGALKYHGVFAYVARPKQ
jgi:hypothetical protein